MTLIDKAEVLRLAREVRCGNCGAWIDPENPRPECCERPDWREGRDDQQLARAIAALPARDVPGVKPFGWIGGNAACHHAHVNELAEGLQSCTSCGAVRGTALAPSPARGVREAALRQAAAEAAGEVAAHGQAELAPFLRRRILALIGEPRT